MKKRHVFLDMLRALAVAEMIHGHSLDGLLDVALRDTPFFLSWTHVRGYTAPMFLFAAGFAFAIATLPRIDAYARFSNELVRRIQKLFVMISLGYLMYLPYFSLRKTILSIGSPEWHSFLSVDILRCIGVSLLILQIWLFFKPRKLLMLSVIWIITILVPVLSPYVGQHSFVHGLPNFLKFYFTGSRFPLFHYSSYLFLGFLIGYLFNGGRRYWSGVSLGAAVFFIVMVQVSRIWGLMPSLQGFMIKGGVIILITVALERLEPLWERLPWALKYFGKEPLLVYVVHVVIIYGSVLSKGLNYYWGAMLLLAYVWHKLKLEHPRTAHRVKRTISWSFIILFLLKPY